MSESYFIDGGGYKQLCMAMLREAAQSMGSRSDAGAKQSNLDWLNGADAVIPYSLCMAAMGLDEHAEVIRELIINSPEKAFKYIVSAQSMVGFDSRLNVLATLDEDSEGSSSYRRGARYVG